jgi:signal transduction histidine kinase
MSPSKDIQPDGLGDDFFAQLFYQLPERKVVFTAHPPYVFEAVTDAHLELTGLRREAMIGREFFSLFPDNSETFKKTGVSPLAQIFEKIVRTKKPASETMRYDIPGPDGKFMERYWRVTHYPITGKSGKVEHILQVSMNVTSEVTAERDFKELREQLEEALAIGKVGSWVWDVDHDMVVADSNLAHMFHLNPKDTKRGMPIEKFTASIYAEDKKRIEKSIRYAVQSKTVFEEEYRIVQPDKRIIWVLARGRVEHGTNRTVFPGVIVDITERRNLQAEIELARQQDKLNRQAAKALQGRNEELEALSRTKDEFVALASHQLRTPATAVKQYLGMVLQGYVGEITEVQNEMLGKAFESNERQIQIVNQILNAARVDTGRLVMSTSPVNIGNLVNGVAYDMQSSIEAHKHTLKLEIPETEIMVMADAGYMRMVVENLIGNAVAYTPDGGVITVTVQKMKHECRLSVTDTGVGIRKADISKLFTKFSRIHNPLSVQAGGSGIGLYLAAEIIRLHNGTISVDSRIHKGTTFAISLPLLQNEPITKRSS